MREPFLERRGCCCTWHVPLLGRGRAAVVADRCGQGPRLEMRAVKPPGNRDQRRDGRRRGCEEAECRRWVEGAVGREGGQFGGCGCCSG